MCEHLTTYTFVDVQTNSEQVNSQAAQTNKQTNERTSEPANGQPNDYIGFYIRSIRGFHRNRPVLIASPRYGQSEFSDFSTHYGHLYLLSLLHVLFPFIFLLSVVKLECNRKRLKLFQTKLLPVLKLLGRSVSVKNRFSCIAYCMHTHRHTLNRSIKTMEQTNIHSTYGSEMHTLTIEQCTNSLFRCI